MANSILKKLALVGVVGLGALGVFASASIVETNDASTYQIKQAAVSGELTIRDTPGMYYQGFADIADYRFSDTNNFKIRDVRFRDGSTATITGTVRYRLPSSYKERIALHREVHSYSGVSVGMVPQATEDALNASTKLFGAEEVYSTDSAKFVQLFKEQLETGTYQTKSVDQVNIIVRDDNGAPLLAKRSVLGIYGIDVINVEITSLDFDDKTDALIASRKEAEQQETLARAEANRADQDAKTAKSRGLATVAKVKYEALAIKEQAVIKAEQKTAMEVEKTKQANEYALQVEATKKAEAAGNRALVLAGLTPLEKATIDMKTKIGVAQHMSKLKLPTIWISGEGGQNDPLTALNLKMLGDVVANPKVMGR